MPTYSKIIGRQFQFGIAKESTRGTAPSSPDFWIPVTEMAIEEKDTKVLDEQTHGVIEESVGQTIVKQWAEGNYKAPIGDLHFPLVLYSLLGSLSSAPNADPSNAVYDHTIAVAQNAQHQSIALYIKDPAASGNAQDYKHANGVVSSLEITYEVLKFLEYTATLKALKGAGATLTASAAADNRFVPKHATFKLAADLASLGAASPTTIKMLQLKINQNIEEYDALGSAAPVDFLNKQFMIEGTLEALWDNENTFKELALAATPKAMRLDLANTDVTIGTSAHPEIRIDLAKVVFKDITRPIKVNDLVKQTLSFTGHYSVSDGKAISVVCTNTHASY